MIKIVDYGMGNLRSVQKAFEKIGAEAVIVSSPADAANAQRLVLPGVGAFRDAIHELRRHSDIQFKRIAQLQADVDALTRRVDRG